MFYNYCYYTVVETPNLFNLHFSDRSSWFEMLDEDLDGEVSRPEFSTLISIMDLDSDKKTSFDELSTFLKSNAATFCKEFEDQLAEITVADISNDMSDDEFRDAARLVWDEHDQDNDGRLILSDFIEVYLVVHPNSVMQYATPSDWKKVYKLYDQDKDEHISWDEAWFVF